ncbi:hypothetical protein ABFS82_05G079000 [Erythranthe guttata]|nr:PREDICTED: uncharacterized protein LOC105954137 [Erythranthe guttata]|eukprot:XP_012833265.1 PREDICTED: uncharacterized protein LOC105954137 [Erythranthe guttata]
MRKSVQQQQQLENNSLPGRDDDDDGISSSSESEYSFSVARVAVAQICQSMGFTGAQKMALEALTDVATMYLKAIAKLGAASANSNGSRTQSNIPDVIVALEDLGSVQGFAGSSTVRERSVYTSAVIKDLIKFVNYSDEIPFARPLPPRTSFSPRQTSSTLHYDDEGGSKHVPRWLPPAVPVVVEVEKRKRWWGCLEEERENQNWEKNTVVENETSSVINNNDIDISSAKRAKVRFKLGLEKGFCEY